MKAVLVTFLVIFSASLSIALEPPKTPCEFATGWRAEVCAFAKANLKHSAWGFEHGMRDYLMAARISQIDELGADDDVLFAAGLLHDMGGLPPYEKEGVDHAVRSAELVGDVLKPTGFPMEKLDAVKDAILTHSYYHPTAPTTPAGIALHDADALDFLGTIGVARILSVVEREAAAPNLDGAVAILEKFSTTLESKLHGGAFSRAEGKRRAESAQAFLSALRRESFGILGKNGG